MEKNCAKNIHLCSRPASDAKHYHPTSSHHSQVGYYCNCLLGAT